jgi:mannosyl-3-phosphoglycerate phosphatase
VASANYSLKNTMDSTNPMLNIKKTILLSDLDGTFLDHHTYSYSESLPAFKKAIDFGWLVAFVTSKTAVEVINLVEVLKEHKITTPIPFIVENGSGIYLPKGLAEDIDFRQLNDDIQTEERESFIVLSYGQVCYDDLVRVLKKRVEPEIGKKTIGFNDIPAKKLAEISGLSEKQATLAKKREFDEPFYIVEGTEDDYLKTQNIIEDNGYSFHRGGRFSHISINQDKGRAAELFLDIIRMKFSPIRSLGIGDAENDLPMLRICNRGFLVGRDESSIIEKDLPMNVEIIKEVGPKGFAKVVDDQLFQNL